MMTYNCEHCKDTGRAFDPDNPPYKHVCPVCDGGDIKTAIQELRRIRGEFGIYNGRNTTMTLVSTVIGNGMLNDN